MSRSLALSAHLVLLCALAGCPAGTTTSGAGTSGLRRLRASGRVATHYGRHEAVELDGVEGQVMAALARAARDAGRPVPRADLAAQRAAREICLAMPRKGPPPSAVVEFALRSYGIVDPPPHMVIANMPPGLESEVIGQLAARLRQILGDKSFSRVGIGVAAPRGAGAEWRRVLVALLEHRVDFDPLPRRLGKGQRVQVRFRPHSTHHAVRLVVTTPDGKTEKGEPSGGGTITGGLSCAKRGVYQVEVIGVGAFGPEVLANFPVYCDTDPPNEVHVGAVKPLSDDDGTLERELFRGTNRIRRKAGLPPLKEHRGLAEVARRHSQDMRDNRFVGHVSPTTGRPVDRIQAAGILHLVVRENVAQAYSVEEALRELMGSPAHRENILATDVDWLGVGVKVNRSGQTPVMLVTQLFMKAGKAYNPKTAEADVLGALRAGRRSVGLRPLKVDEALTRLAREHVKALIAGGERKARADATLSAGLRRMGRRFNRVDGLQVRLSVIEALQQAEEIKRKRYSHVGIGVGRAGSQVVIFLLLAGR